MDLTDKYKIKNEFKDIDELKLHAAKKDKQKKYIKQNAKRRKNTTKRP